MQNYTKMQFTEVRHKLYLLLGMPVKEPLSDLVQLSRNQCKIFVLMLQTMLLVGLPVKSPIEEESLKICQLMVEQHPLLVKCQ